MATYFDPTNPDHVALLPKTLRTAADLASVAARVEEETIAWYREYHADGLYTYVPLLEGTLPDAYDEGDYYFICLRGFTPNADDCTNLNLVKALRATIADGIAHRLLQSKENPLVTSIAGSKTQSKTMRPDAATKWPEDWGWRLLPYDSRRGTYLV